jgi:hypothetical protein
MDSGQLCIYCGVQPGTTVDHVPPKLLLAEPYPPNLFTVPACPKCNRNFQKDDEYTRTVVFMDLRIAGVPAAKPKRPAFLRSLERPQSQRFIQYLAGQIEPGMLYGADGKRIDKLNRDHSRTDATGLHILKGLHFKEIGSRLDMSAVPVQIDSKMGFGLDHPLFSKFLTYYEQAQDRRYGSFGDCFSYRAIIREHLSAWLFVLYDKFTWFSLIGTPMNAAAESNQGQNYTS